MEAKNIFAKRLIELREARGISQQILADALGVTRQSLSLYEKAERTVNVELLVRIANYFDVSSDYLLGLSDVASTDSDVKVACKATGLNEEAVLALNEKMNELQNFYSDSAIETYFQVRNEIVCSDFWDSILISCCGLLDNSKQMLNIGDITFGHTSMLAEKINVPKYELMLHLYENAECTNKSENSHVGASLEEQCDLCRYNILKTTEKISDMFDKRHEYLNYSTEELLSFLKIDDERLEQMRGENLNGKHNPPKE